MTPYTKRRCKITNRLAENLMIRNMADATIDAYSYRVRRFADCIQKPLTDVAVEDVRDFQPHVINSRTLAYRTFRQAIGFELLIERGCNDFSGAKGETFLFDCTGGNACS